MKKKQDNPGLVFFVFRKQEGLEEEEISVPEGIDGIHKLARFLLSCFLTGIGYVLTEESKKEFVTNVLAGEKNKKFTPEEACERLSLAIVSVFIVKKNDLNTPLNVREKKHIEYSIEKELNYSYFNKNQ